MTKPSFTDVYLWFALAVGDHPQYSPALRWENEESSLGGFSWLTQVGLMRLLTTASGGQPLPKQEAWRVYEGFLSDSRVRVFPELPALEDLFRSYSKLRQASPKIWVEPYLAGHAAANAVSTSICRRCSYQRAGAATCPQTGRAANSCSMAWQRQ